MSNGIKWYQGGLKRENYAMNKQESKWNAVKLKCKNGKCAVMIKMLEK